MKAWPLAVIALVSLSAALSARAREPMLAGVTNPRQAHQDYILKCQGCHRPDGGGDDRSTPPIRGTVARFLTVPEGRKFIGQVPGVATVDLDDQRLAELINWTLYRFDAANIPDNFRPYSAPEIAALRRTPLRLDRAATRARLAAGFSTAGTEHKQQ